MSRRRRGPLPTCLATAVALVAGCASPGAGEPGVARVTGTVAYRERMALPPHAVLEVRIEDVSGREVLAAQRVELAGRQVPIPFALAVDRARIDPLGPYAVRAEIRVEGRALFASSEPQPVLTQGHPNAVDLVLARADGGDEPAAAASLAYTYWRLIELGGEPVRPTDDHHEPHLILQAGDDHFHGAGGINQFRGTYAVDGDALELRPGPTTLMAGDPGSMQREQAFLEALRRVTSYRIEGDRLTLATDGAPLLAFRAVAPE